MVAAQSGTGYWQWRPAGGIFGGAGEGQPYLGGVADNYVHDGSDFFSLNVSIPSMLGPRNALLNQTATIQVVREGEYIIVGYSGRNDERGVATGYLMCLSLERGKEGQKLWETTFTPPLASQDWYSGMSSLSVFPEQDVFYFSSATELKNPIVYDMKTGQQLWAGNQSAEPQLSYYGFQTMVYDNMIITGGQRSEERRRGPVPMASTSTSSGCRTRASRRMAPSLAGFERRSSPAIRLAESPSRPTALAPGR
jgi:hypothetical protein